MVKVELKADRNSETWDGTINGHALKSLDKGSIRRRVATTSDLNRNLAIIFRILDPVPKENVHTVSFGVN
jgi:hypothetical protein